MGCLRCGKEIQEKGVFCEECKKNMEDYPIKPGTVVVIPYREPKQPEKRSRRKARADRRTEKKAEKQASKKLSKKNSKKLPPTERDNRQLRRITRLLLVTAVALLGAVCFLAYMLFREHF